MSKTEKELRELLDLSYSALREAEAILGGEYGDHYNNLCEMMLELQDRIKELDKGSECSD